MYEFWYDYIKPKVSKQCKTMLHGDSFITYIKTEGVYEDIADDAEKDLIYQITKSIDHCLQERIKKGLD